MGLALGPKVGAVLASPKGKRKAAAVALGVAAAGFLTSCMMRGGGAEEESVETPKEQPVGKTVDAAFDENDMSAVYGHNPNQAAFERGEFDAENRMAGIARVAEEAEKSDK